MKVVTYRATWPLFEAGPKNFFILSYILENGNHKKIIYILGNKNSKKLVILQKMELLTPISKKQNNSPRKKDYYISGTGLFLPKKNLIKLFLNFEFKKT